MKPALVAACGLAVLFARGTIASGPPLDLRGYMDSSGAITVHHNGQSVDPYFALQALLLAHGGFTTMGANVFSMGVAGPFVAYMAFKAMTKARVRTSVKVFITVFLAGMVTYITTAVQLALAYGPFEDSLISFLAVFAITQIPLGIVEGILFAIFIDYLERARPDLTEKVFPRRVKDEA